MRQQAPAVWARFGGERRSWRARWHAWGRVGGGRVYDASSLAGGVARPTGLRASGEASLLQYFSSCRRAAAPRRYRSERAWPIPSTACRSSSLAIDRRSTAVDATHCLDSPLNYYAYTYHRLPYPYLFTLCSRCTN